MATIKVGDTVYCAMFDWVNDKPVVGTAVVTKVGPKTLVVQAKEPKHFGFKTHHAREAVYLTPREALQALHAEQTAKVSEIENRLREAQRLLALAAAAIQATPLKGPPGGLDAPPKAD